MAETNLQAANDRIQELAQKVLDLLDNKRDGYLEGYSKGHKDGYEARGDENRRERQCWDIHQQTSEQYNAAYNRGRANGYAEGHKKGYRQGVESCNVDG